MPPSLSEPARSLPLPSRSQNRTRGGAALNGIEPRIMPSAQGSESTDSPRGEQPERQASRILGCTRGVGSIFSVRTAAISLAGRVLPWPSSRTLTGQLNGCGCLAVRDGLDGF